MNCPVCDGVMLATNKRVLKDGIIIRVTCQDCGFWQSIWESFKGE